MEDISDHELRLKVYSATGQFVQCIIIIHILCVKICCFSYKGTTIAVCALEIIVKGALVFLQFLTITKNVVNSKTKILRLVVSHNSLCYLFQRLCIYFHFS